MKRNFEKAATSVVVILPKEDYEDYVETVDERGYKRQKYNSDIFQKAVEQDVTDYKKNSNKRESNGKRNSEQGEISVVLLLPIKIYDSYAVTLNERGLKRQMHSSELFIKAMEQDLIDYKKSLKKKAV